VKHSIAAVARMANLSPDVIRSWERRYNIVSPERDASGVRLYSDREVARLTLARQATRLGHPIRRVAQLSDAEIEALLDRKPEPATANADVVQRLLATIENNDLAGATNVLRASALLLPPRDFALEVLAPALREVGRQWEHGTLAVWQEHFLSNQIAQLTSTLPYATPDSARMVLATPPFDRHGFGIGLAALLASSRGVAVCNLGVEVPAAELVAAARRLKAAAVVVGMTHAQTPPAEALAYAREVDAGLPSGVDLLLGGELGERAAQSLKSKRVRGVATLEAFEALCAEWR